MTNASQASTALQDSLATLINKAVSGMDASVAFLQQQLPDVIHQLLLWKMVDSVVTGLILLIPILIALTLLCMKKVDFTHDAKFLTTFVFAVVGVISLLTTPVAIIQFKTALFIWLAPKVWLIEYAASLVK